MSLLNKRLILTILVVIGAFIILPRLGFHLDKVNVLFTEWSRENQQQKNKATSQLSANTNLDNKINQTDYGNVKTYENPKVDTSIPSDLLPLSMSEFLKQLHNDSLTDLQRDSFIGKSRGRHVSWEGYVAGITPMWEGHPEKGILMLVYSNPNKYAPDEPVPIRFPLSARPDLELLTEGDWVSFQGVLDFIKTTDERPTIRNGILLKYRKSK